MQLSQSSQALLERSVDAGVADVSAAAGTALALYENLDQVAGLWRQLEADGAGSPFQTWAWHAAWQRTIGDATGSRPAIVVVRDRGRVVMVAPFAVERDRWVTRLVWHASALCDYNAPLVSGDFAASAGKGTFRALFADMLALVAARPGLAFDAVSLTKMPESLGGEPNPFLSLATTPNPSGAHMATLGASWDEFYAARRSASTRRRDRNKRRRLAKIGDVRLMTAEGPEQIGDTLDALFAQKSRQLAAMGVADIFADAATRAFFREVATDPRNRDLVHVSCLEVDGRPAAVNLGLIQRNTYAHVLVSHDSGETARFGAGTAHLHELLAYAIDRGCHTFDFTIGDEPYKREWSDRSVMLHDHRSAVTARGLLATAPAAVAARIKRTVKQNPTLWRLATSVRALRAGRKAVEPEARDSGEDE